MKRIFLIIVTLIPFLGCQVGHAVSVFGSLGNAFGGSAGGGGAAGASRQFMIAPSVSYDIETLETNVGPATGTPNTFSTLKWEKMHVMRVHAKARGQINGVVLRGDISYGHILKGTFVDNDYAGNGRTLMWSQSKSKIKGSMIDVLLGVGMPAGKIFTPMAGLFYAHKTLKMEKPQQTVTNLANYNAFQVAQPVIGPSIGAPPAVGPVTQVRTPTYTVDLYGPWIGGEMDWKLGQSFHILGDMRVLYFWYKAKGKWPTFSFKDEANGFGVISSIGVEYEVTPSFSVTGKIGGMYLKIDNGKLRQGNFTLPRFKGLNKNISVALGAHIKL